MAVFSAGITLSAIKISINWQVILGSILKMIMMPAVLLIMGLIFHMDPLNLKMLVVAGALPPAFSGIIIADEYDTYVAEGTSSLTLSVILFIGFCPLGSDHRPLPRRIFLKRFQAVCQAAMKLIRV